MRVLHVNDLPLDSGTGAEIYISRLAEAQRRAGDDVRHFSAPREHRSIGRLLDVWDTGAARDLRATIEETAPDIVHFHNVIRELSPSVLGAAGSVPALTTVHELRVFGGLEHHLPDPRAAVDRALLGPIVRRELRRHMDLLVAVSDAVKRHVAEYGFPDVVVVRVPVPPPLVPPEPVGQCHDVAFVGRLARDKGPQVLLTAFEAVADLHPSARLVFVGDGPLRADLAVRARSLERVVFTGQLDQKDVSATIGRARVVVTPSIPALRPEGSSLTTAEAARHGRPVVTSDDPAVAEVATTVGGQVVPAGDPVRLADALDHWLGDPVAATAAGERARLAATDAYDVDSVRVRMEEVYTSILNHRPRGRVGQKDRFRKRPKLTARRYPRRQSPPV